VKNAGGGAARGRDGRPNCARRQTGGPAGRAILQIRVELNLRTARALGVVLPDKLLALADEEIE
jgi:hypothetical protein